MLKEKRREEIERYIGFMPTGSYDEIAVRKRWYDMISDLLAEIDKLTRENQEIKAFPLKIQAAHNEQIDRLKSAYDAQAEIIHRLEGDVTRLEEERDLLKEQVQVSSDFIAGLETACGVLREEIRALKRRIEIYGCARSGETG